MTDNIDKEIIPLIEYALNFSQVALLDTGEFYPFGAKIEVDHLKLTPVAYYDGNEFPNSNELINALSSILDKELKDQGILAFSVVYDVRTINPSNGQKTDAICIKVRHRDIQEALFYYYPYSLNSINTASLGTPWTTNE
jgi:hypothetical protein